jgi:hypothetical protein
MIGLLPGLATAAGTLVEYGSSAGATQTPYADWNQLLYPAACTEFVDPDGNPDHSGIVETSSVPDVETAYFGIQGTTPINFQVGDRIVATFYNRSGGEEYLACRVSFADADAPDSSDDANPWHTMYSTAEGYANPFLVPVAGHGTMEMEYYFTDADRVSAPDDSATAGNHTRVNLNLPISNPQFVLTKIVWTNDADITPPPAPANLQVNMVSTSAGAGNTVVELTWDPVTDPGTNALGLRTYLIYRDGALYDMVLPEMIDYYGASPRFRDLFVKPGTAYAYTVTAVDRALYGMYPTVEYPDRRFGNESPHSNTAALTVPDNVSNTVVDPARLTYEGAIRFPHDPQEIDWEYTHRALAYYPQGNPGYDPGTELPGSLFAVNNADETAELSIPIPVDSGNVTDLPRAETLTSLTDIFPAIYDGSSTPGGGGLKAIGLSYHPAAGGVTERLYYTIGNTYGTDQDAPAMGAFDVNLTAATAAWHIGGTPPNNVYPGLLSTIAFESDHDWADAHTGGRSLIVGNAYISGYGVPSGGPSLYAVAPWEDGSLPANGESISAVTLLQYASGTTPGEQNINFSYDEFAEGGAWLTHVDRHGVVVSYRRSVGDWWYGYANGVGICEYNIPTPPFGDHGTGATDWEAGLLFYNPADLAEVAAGTLDPHEPLPYAGFDLAEYAMDPDSGRRAGAIAYDRARGYLYFIDHNGDPGYSSYSLLHVFRLSTGSAFTYADEINVLQILTNAAVTPTVSPLAGGVVGLDNAAYILQDLRLMR